MDDLIRMMPQHADEIVWILDAVMQLQKDPGADISEVCRHYDLSVVASFMVLYIFEYNDRNPIRENTLACGYQGESPEWSGDGKRSMPLIYDAPQNEG